jgi:ABC-type transport system substrate-binding protein
VRAPLLAAALVALAAPACRDPYPRPRFRGAGSATPHRGGTLRFAFDGDLTTIDPARANDTLAGVPTRLVHEGLVNYAPGSTEIVPALAERWEVSADGRTYTFHLRPGIVFSDGTVITSEDFRYSWERMLNPRRIPCPGAENYRLIVGYDDFREGRAAHLAGLVTPDPRTVVLHLTDADRTFLHIMAMRFVSVVPRHVLARIGDERFSQQPVGAGPFTLERWEPNARVVMRRNPRYWNASHIYLDAIEVELSIARHLQFMRFLAGEIDYAHSFSLSTADYLWLLNNREWRPYVVRQPGTLIGGFMMNTEMPPFDNVHVRRAVTYALDRDAIARARNYRIAPAWSLYPPTIPGYRADNPLRQRYDLAAARREMALAGYPDGLPEEVTLWLGEGETGSIYGDLVQADLRRIGIRVRQRPAAFSIYYATLGRRRTVQLAFTGWQMDYPDPSNFIEPNFHSRAIHDEQSGNHAFYSNHTLDRLLDQAKIEPDTATRLRLYEQAEDVLLQDAPWAYMYTSLNIFVTQPYVRGWAPHPVWPDYLGEAWLDLPLRDFVAARASHRRALGAAAAALALPFTSLGAGR